MFGISMWTISSGQSQEPVMWPKTLCWWMLTTELLWNHNLTSAAPRFYSIIWMNFSVYRSCIISPSRDREYIPFDVHKAWKQKSIRSINTGRRVCVWFVFRGILFLSSVIWKWLHCSSLILTRSAMTSILVCMRRTSFWILITCTAYSESGQMKRTHIQRFTVNHFAR